MRPRSIAIVLLALLGASVASPASRSAFKKSQFKVSYRQILDGWARGDSARSLEGLLELETLSVPEAKRRDLEQMWKAKLSVVRDLLKAGPEVLVPVTQLHQSAYLAYLGRGNHALAAHSRSLTLELAELYAERVEGAAEGEWLAGAIMTSLGGHLQESFMYSMAIDMYERALEIDPGNVAALLGQVGILERHGRYDQTLSRLRALVEAAPYEPEGQLRLAVQLARHGEADDAEAHFDRLISGEVPAPEWMRSLAYQESCRILVDRGELDAASVLMGRGVVELPGDPTLPILLAYVTDRAGQPTRRAELSEALQLSTASGELSPRYLYSRMPRRALDALRAELEASTAERLPRLAAALSSDRARVVGGS